MNDLISRDALMRNFCGTDLTMCVKYGNQTAEQQHESYSTMMMYEIAETIEDAPSIDAVLVVHGEWMMKKHDIYTTCACSRCGTEFEWSLMTYNFCPNCGAKMDGVQNA